MSTKELQFYTATNNKKPFNEWLKKINEPTQGSNDAWIDLVQAIIFLKLRRQFGPGYRIYFAEIDGIIILLLCGGDKNTQSRDIKKAKQYWQEFIKRVYT